MRAKQVKVVSKKKEAAPEEEEPQIDLGESSEEPQIDLAQQLKNESQLVTVSITRELSPPPKIGSYNGQTETGVGIWKPGQKYRVPVAVAAVLQDANSAIV